MSKILGLLDALESIILDSKKVPLSTKIMVDEAPLIEIIDKVRITLRSEELNNQHKINREVEHQPVSSEKNLQQLDTQKKYIEDELKKINKLREGADDYAKYILSNLQLTVTKMQNNLAKLEKNIESGRKVIDDKNELKLSNTE